MDRIFPNIPNVAFYKIINHYAFETGKPVFTMVDRDTALINYLAFAIKNN